LAVPVPRTPKPRYLPSPIGPEGSFRIGALSPGKNRIFITSSEPSQGFFVSSVQRDGVEQPGALIDVGAGDQVTGVRVIVSYGSGVIRGQVKYAGGLPAPAPEATVVATLAADSRISKYAPVDSRGLFVMEGVRDGEYDLALEIYSRTPGQEFHSSTQRITVTQGSAPDVVFRVSLGKPE